MNNKIQIKPYGLVLKDRLDLFTKYKLVKQISPMFYVPTSKCTENYDMIGEYLRGEIEKPKKVDKRTKSLENLFVL